jgi:2-desacetyl-2-hydroxyethyl bacteriochlorophyllide A dehydrogenase
MPGGMAEYVTVPEKAAFNIGNLPFEYGSLTEPLSCVLHGIERSRIKLGDKVLIFGAGPIGLLLLKAILLQGASEVTQVDKNKSRLELAKKSGAAYIAETIDGLPKDAYDVVVDASGVMFLWEQAVNFVRNSGTILYFGVPRKDAVLTLPAFVFFTKELYLVTSYTSVRNSIQSIRLLQSGKLDVKDIISHQLPLEDFVKGVEIIEKGTEGALKIVICPEK